MTKRILVAYASATGSTAEVGEAIGEIIEGEGDVQVETADVRDVPSLAGYDGVVLGSSIRAGRWLPRAVEFLEAHREELAQIPVAYFTACLTMVQDTEESRRTVLSYMEPVLNLAPEVEPVALGLFAGSLEPARQRIYGEATPYGDYRDWEAIRAWATAIRPEILSGSGRKDSRTVLGGALSRGAHLAYRNLSGADLVGAKLEESDLKRTDLQKAGLSWAELAGSDLEDANLRRANLIGANLREANLRGAALRGAVLNGADLSEADLSEADLSGADLNWALLRNAKLRGVNLRQATLGWADLRDADLSEADLQGAQYNERTIWPEEFDPVASGCRLVSGPG